LIHLQDRTESSGADGAWVGVDAGATLAKIALRSAGGELSFDTLPSSDPDAVLARIAALGADRAGLTGAGAAALAERLECPSAQINEFAAWGAGARGLLANADEAAPTRFMVVSLGTGTSVLLVDGLSAQRIGGTALGGGTVVGLGCSLCNAIDFDELCKLAAEGDTGRVDLRVSDIYRSGEIPLAGDITAANFGGLAIRGTDGVSRADLAAGVMNLVGENIGLICAGLAAAVQVEVVALGGSTLRNNPALVGSLTQITAAVGRRPVLLERGGHAGALGALELARARD
jgi:type II pantothenate kinase